MNIKYRFSKSKQRIVKFIKFFDNIGYKIKSPKKLNYIPYFNSIAIIQLGHLGDFLLTLPFLYELKHNTIIFGSLVIFSALYIDSLRHSQYNPLNILQTELVKIFYGNNFSDTRDFAWILSYQNGEYFLGKTYIAGLISFIPKFISEFRSQWAISVATNKIVGFSPSEHAGLRPGMFGEVYFNFGILGVIFLGLIASYFLRYVDLQIKKSVVIHGDIIKSYSKTVIYGFISKFFITAGFLVFINFVLFFLNSILLSKRRKKDKCF